jgi:hypothetical protein
MENSKMKITVSFIGTGNYLNFLPSWYENVTENFLPEVKKNILVFTDGEGDFPENIKVYHQEHLDWPYITLKRFEILQKAIGEIENSDWYVFLDADLFPVEKITIEEFFDNSKPYFGVHHPCHFLQMPPHNKLPGSFDTTPNSKACIGDGDNLSIYYQGCLWGGKGKEISQMINNLSDRVNEDLDNNIIATWHDESHLNKFYSQNKDKVNVLSPQYAYPEVFSNYCNFDRKMVHLSKDNSKFHV